MVGDYRAITSITAKTLCRLARPCSFAELRIKCNSLLGEYAEPRGGNVPLSAVRGSRKNHGGAESDFPAIDGGVDAVRGIGEIRIK